MIKLDDTYYLDADSKNFILKKFPSGNNKSDTVVGYYSTVPQALRALQELDLKDAIKYLETFIQVSEEFNRIMEKRIKISCNA